MVKSRSSRLRPLMFWFTPITRSPAQKSACKDLKRNGQSPAITLKAAYTPTSNRAGSRSLSITRSPAQKSACKDLGRNGQDRAITTKATYTPVPNRAGSRSPHIDPVIITGYNAANAMIKRVAFFFFSDGMVGVNLERRA